MSIVHDITTDRALFLYAHAREEQFRTAAREVCSVLAMYGLGPDDRVRYSAQDGYAVCRYEERWRGVARQIAIATLLQNTVYDVAIREKYDPSFRGTM